MAAHLFRENSGKMLAVLTRMFGLQQIDDLLDVVHDTFESALIQWRYQGVPVNAPGWLMQVAKNKSINKFKRNSKIISFSSSSFIENADTSFEIQMEHLLLADEIEDSQLRLLLTCCSPVFSEKNQIILTLNILCGFGTSEISNALLMNKDAVKKALLRTKMELKQMGHLLLTPLPLKLKKRVRIVHTILYLVFNEGYKTTRNNCVINNDLCYEAIRLTKMMLKPGVALKSESNALLALMFFNLSRFPSRINLEGEIMSLQEQDRKKWDRVFIEEGYHYLKTATTDDTISPYHIEAIIASLHCSAATYEDTDWTKIAYLYYQLEQLTKSPMVSLNRIVAESYLTNSMLQLEQLDKLKNNPSLKNHYLLYAAEGDLLKRSGKLGQAKIAFEKACKLVTSSTDKRFIQKKISECIPDENLK
jgi:RNA polymerase sigma-70 factor (ECF subfamily)